MKIKRLLLLLALPLVVASCTSYKNVPYLQNPEAVNDSEEILPLYDAKIMPKDLLSITVNTTDPKSATPFNLTVQTPINAALTNISTTTQPTMQQYLVNNKGEIDFPVIGRLAVGGLTKNEAEESNSFSFFYASSLVLDSLPRLRVVELGSASFFSISQARFRSDPSRVD